MNSARKWASGSERRLHIFAQRYGKRHRIERLGNHPDGAERSETIGLAGPRSGGHEDDGEMRRLRVLAQLSQRRRTVKPRHHDVEQDDVRSPLGCDGERLAAGFAALHREIRIQTERNFHHFADIRLVIDMEDTNCGHATSFCGSADRSPSRSRTTELRNSREDVISDRANSTGSPPESFGLEFEKTTTGMILPEPSRSSGKRSNPDPCPADIDDGKVDAIGRQHLTRAFHAIHRHDIGNRVQLMRNDGKGVAIVIDVEDARPRTRCDDSTASRRVVRCSTLIGRLTHSRALSPCDFALALQRSGSSDADEDQSVAMMRLPSDLGDQFEAVAIVKRQRDHEGRITVGAGADDRGLNRMGEIHREAGPRQSHPQRFLDRRILPAKQNPPRRAFGDQIDGASDCVVPHRQIDMKDRAATGGILETDLAAQPFDDLLDDAETEPGPAFLSGIRRIGLGEFLEDMRLEAVGDAWTMIAHGDPESVPMVLHRDPHHAAASGRI